MVTSRAIGIDLGTTFSCVGVLQDGEIEIIANGNGKRTTPSIVQYSDDHLKYVGQFAKNRISKMPLNTIFAVKRMMGKQFDDPQLQEDIKNFPFKVVNNGGKAAVEVEVNHSKSIKTPEEISALILQNLMQTAKNHLGHEVKDAVITIPAYFNNAQRQATVDAGKLAGLNVLQIINEPTAAIAYAFKQPEKNQTLLVYDLGGGTFDVSIIKIHDGSCEVLAVSGDCHLGGEDFDNVLVKYGIEQFEFKHGIDISNNARAVSKLKAECETAKRLLSGRHFTPIEVDELYDGKDLNCKITVTKFNELCQHLVDKTLGPVQRALVDAKLTKNDINEVLLVGGSTRIPIIQSSLSDFFDGKTLKADINADEAVAYGATLLAASLSKDFDSSIRNIRLIDVAPHSLGTDSYTHKGDKKGYFDVIVPRNTKIPFEVKGVRTTLYKNQNEMDFIIFEGEDDDLEKNSRLGTFTLFNIAPAPQGVPKIEVIFKIDENGILKVSARDNRNGSSNFIEIKPNVGSSKENEDVEMITEIPVIDLD